MGTQRQAIVSAPPLGSARFTVEDLSFLQAKLLWCYEGEVTPENRRKFTREHHLHVWWLRRGSVTVRSGTKSWSAREDDWIFGLPGPHHQEFSEDAVILSINFKVEWPSGDSLIDQPLVIPARDFPDLARAARPLVRFIRRHYPGTRNDLGAALADLVSFFELQQYFSRWMVAYLRAVLASGIMPARMAGLDARVLAALRRLHRQAWSVPFREKELAKEIGLSASHLDRLFVQQLGLTPRAYLQKRRYESTAAALRGTTVSIKTIGYDFGFSSPGHFCHWFQKASGKTPREFRADEISAKVPMSNRPS